MSDSDYKALERRVDQLEKETLLLHQEHKFLREAMETVKDRIDGMNSKKLTPMQNQLSDIHNSLHGAKGFWAGAMLTVGALWAVLGTFGYAIWRIFDPNG